MNRFVALYQLLDEASGTRDRELACSSTLPLPLPPRRPGRCMC